MTAYEKLTGEAQLKMLLKSELTRPIVNQISRQAIQQVYPACVDLNIFGTLEPWTGNAKVYQELAKFQSEIALPADTVADTATAAADTATKSKASSKNRSLPFQIMTACIRTSSDDL